MIFMQDPLFNGFNETRNGKRNEKENEANVRRKTRQMNFVDTAAYKGIRFETKQNLNYK